ncbi:MAG TPA: J domain-containing protein [Candidatus Fermentibacter daniensis]|nr:J domain-containing protein [Candidatus Fermentibacter daniensis]HOR06854.1 J domain-containing protein [Candidatus Fermentibacter daniensis]HPK51083.1 J domain-containing protein [Candidatus Fermentibacter daniensis]HQE56489.1 J domain-containing protein [Candidatus Fermentibacter daniensis]HQH92107.1 J domain-containing protein [Candidatus Fermentibacter daniensis]
MTDRASHGAQQDYYQILGVPRSASREDIEKAYFDLARTLHPDIAGGGPEATARFMLINEAYQVIGSPSSRREYDLTLGPESFAAASTTVKREPAVTPAGPSTGATAGPSAAAARVDEPRAGAAQRLDEKVRRIIRQADRLCEQGNFWQAADLMQRLLPQYPRQPALRRALARAASGKMRYHEAAQHLKIACEVEYFNSDNHVLLGEAFIKGRQWQKAHDALTDALSWNEDNDRAKRGLEEVQKHLGGGESFFRKLISKLTQPVGGAKKDGKPGAKRK